MIRTYERTMFIEKLEEATVELYVYENSRYSGNVGKETKVEYTGVKSWSIITEEDAEEIEKETDYMCIDENREYLVLNFVDGTTATFRNSHVDMFVFR